MRPHLERSVRSHAHNLCTGGVLDLSHRLSLASSYASLYQHPPGSFRGPKEAGMFIQSLEVMMDLCTRG